MKYNVLVFPCGSEVGLEIFRALRYSTHVNLMGASSADDHGRFVFDNYSGSLPYIFDNQFIPLLNRLINDYKIDVIYPTMDSVSGYLFEHQNQLNCSVLGSSRRASTICLNKVKTYQELEGAVPLPRWSTLHSELNNFPLFVKPQTGYGSRNTHLASNQQSLTNILELYANTPFVFCEYLPGTEYTIDCFSSKKHDVCYVNVRERKRIRNGISVRTNNSDRQTKELYNYAKIISKKIGLEGAWFFQMKEDSNGHAKLLEVSCRLSGTSTISRAQGVNLPLLSIFQHFGIPVNIEPNNYYCELDRAFENKYQTNLNYNTVYVDLDDCIIIQGTVNTLLISFLYQSLNQNKTIVLVTRHAQDLKVTLNTYRIANVFDEIIHIKDKTPKSKVIKDPQSIFIDDSFQERQDVKRKLGIPVFAPDMVEVLLQ